MKEVMGKIAVIAFLLVCLSIPAVSGTTLTAEGGMIAAPGSSAEFSIIADSLPQGLAGYTLTVSLSDPSKAEITGIITPAWAGSPPFGTIGSVPADSVDITLVDLYLNADHSLTNFELITLQIRGDAVGSTQLRISNVDIQDKDGFPIPALIQNGTITIGSPSPPVTTGTLVVQSNPTASNVRLDGAYRGITPMTISGISAGDHTLRVEKTGYYPWENLVTIVAGETNEVTAALTIIPPVPTTGTLQVQSNPTGANVSLDGVYKGITPLTIPNIFPGLHTVRVEKTGYLPWLDTVNINAGETIPVNAALTAAPPTPTTGTINTTSYPSGAEVKLDGTLRGTTPLELPGVSPGTHTLRVELTGFEPFISPVGVTAGSTTYVHAVLEPIPPVITNGTLDIQSDPTGANITLDGVFQGTTPKVIQDIMNGVHTLKLEKTGYAPWEEPVIVLPNQTSTVFAKLSLSPPSTGSIAVESVPENATVYLDGGIAGFTPLAILDVSPGPHIILIELTGYQPYNKGITVTAGGITTVVAALTPVPPPTTGIVDVQSDPAGANVYLDDDLKGLTPIQIPSVSPGLHNVRIELNGYYPFETDIAVLAAQIEFIDVVLELIPPPPNTGALDIITNPSDARVYLNDVLKGTTPLFIVNLDPGAYTIRLEKNGYEPFENVTSVVAGETTLIDVTLTPVTTPSPTTPVGYGTLAVFSSPTNAIIRIDGVQRGKTAAILSQIPAGIRQVTLEKSGYKTKTISVTIKAGTYVTLPMIQLEPDNQPTPVPTTTIPTIIPTIIPTTISPFPPGAKNGSIFVYTTPFGCSVFVDDLYRGKSPGIFGSISPGIHMVRMTHTGYHEEMRSVQVTAGKTTTVTAFLFPNVDSLISVLL